MQKTELTDFQKGTLQSIQLQLDAIYRQLFKMSGECDGLINALGEAASDVQNAHYALSELITNNPL